MRVYTTAAHGGHTERLPNISQIDSFKIVGYLGDRLKNNAAVWLHHVWENNPEGTPLASFGQKVENVASSVEDDEGYTDIMGIFKKKRD